MADLLFVMKDGEIVKLEGDDAIHTFVEQERQTFRETEIEVVYTRVGLMEPNPLIRDRIMARVFLHPFFRKESDWLSGMSDEFYENVITNLKDHISYTLFPMAPEFDKKPEKAHGLAFGGALLRSITNGRRPGVTFTYFQEDWVKPPG